MSTKWGVFMITDLNTTARFIKENARLEPGRTYGERIAVIGAGPAGLSCAYQLALLGYRPVVFEKKSRPGGMLAYAVPAFRFKRNIIEDQVDELRQMRVTIETNVEVGRDVTIDELRSRGYNAFFIAIGCQGGKRLNVEGEDTAGVCSAVDFLEEASSGEKIDLDGQVIVLGGGDVAVDAARMAVRHAMKPHSTVHGPDARVTMICPEQRNEIRASEPELKKALQEGVILQPGWGIIEIRSENGRVSSVVCKRCLTSLDSGGNFNPRYNDNDILEFPCNHLITAVGEQVVWGGLLNGVDVKLGRGQIIVADNETLRTGLEDVFAGGDVHSGPSTVENAIAAGEKAAASIHHYLRLSNDRKSGSDDSEKEKDRKRTGMGIQGFLKGLKDKIRHA